MAVATFYPIRPKKIIASSVQFSSVAQSCPTLCDPMDCSPHTKGMFHAKMGSIKDRNGMDLTEAEDIKKR